MQERPAKRTDAASPLHTLSANRRGASPLQRHPSLMIVCLKSGCAHDCSHTLANYRTDKSAATSMRAGVLADTFECGAAHQRVKSFVSSCHCPRPRESSWPEFRARHNGSTWRASKGVVGGHHSPFNPEARLPLNRALFIGLARLSIE